MQSDLEHAIDVDFGFVDFRRRMDEVKEHREDVRALQDKAAVLIKEIADLQRQRDMLEHGLKELRVKAQRLAAV
jgi:cell division protein FtsB